jgi:hypothetical protein
MSIESNELVSGEISSTTIFFEQLFDKQIPKKIKIVKWCPTMDLLAVVVAAPDETIWIHRLSWQRLWTLNLPEKFSINAISWSPDGILSVSHLFTFCLLDSSNCI